MIQDFRKMRYLRLFDELQARDRTLSKEGHRWGLIRYNPSDSLPSELKRQLAEGERMQTYLDWVSKEALEFKTKKSPKRSSPERE